ncbi:hypothetical protein [Arthrobacter sp. UM1]|uniref:hypothetical protein n=1 Tax=Arthrobacter sp. UM1 TaxID=2766776 RepID=UPI001CF6600A|nr:hypothetical protein [Arthrobacter sp. UM1]MCB4208885.1 hypothetical protein [Arthrobacter sp. UM1]
MTTAAAVVVLALSGCGVFERPLDEPLRSQVRSLLLPSAEIEAAMEKEISICARKFGWTKRVPYSIGGLQTLAGVSGVFSSVASAERIGYAATLRETEDSGAEMTAEQVDGIIGSFEPENLFRYTSPKTGAGTAVPKTGCVSDARIKVYGSLEASIKVSGFANELRGAPLGYQSRIRDLMSSMGASYRSCLQEHGRDFTIGEASEMAGRTWGQYRAHGSPPHAEELELLRIDAGCQEKIGLAAKLDDAVLEGASSWAKRHQNEIAALAVLNEEAQKRAERILAE